ncbi:hypothetical protein LEMLEM_LOCUS12793 [Lemmus lemmus]
MEELLYNVWRTIRERGPSCSVKMQFCLLNRDWFNLKIPAFYESNVFRFYTEVGPVLWCLL